MIGYTYVNGVVDKDVELARSWSVTKDPLVAPMYLFITLDCIYTTFPN